MKRTTHRLWRAAAGRGQPTRQRRNPPRPARLALYVDAIFRERDGEISTTTESVPFLTFAAEVGRHFDEFVVFGRDAPADAEVDQRLPQRPTFVRLPWYSDLGCVGRVARTAAGTCRAFWRGLDRVAVVWIFGPHPYGLVLASLALLRRRRVVLGVRQDTLSYFKSRIRRPSQRPLLIGVLLLDRGWRSLARFLPTVVVGDELERAYAGPRPGVLAMTVSLVHSRDIAVSADRDTRAQSVRLLTVGRIEPEKNPLLLIEALAELVTEAPDRRWELTWVGTGRLATRVAERATELGVENALRLPGFVSPGPRLLDHYRSADVFVHVAVTEGVPQVILEALATATPVVATAVGGVEAALERGAAGLLVPPRDRQALVRAIRDAAVQSAARQRRVVRGLELAREHALENEAAHVAGWLRHQSSRASRA